MIKTKDVIKLKIPYPRVTSCLAVRRHMYICKDNDGTTSRLIKCQTYKPALVVNGTIQNYVIEEADLSRNPFAHQTIIDCDKLFHSELVNVPDSLRTNNRRDISDSLYQDILNKLISPVVENIDINLIKQLNPVTDAPTLQ